MKLQIVRRQIWEREYIWISDFFYSQQLSSAVRKDTAPPNGSFLIIKYSKQQKIEQHLFWWTCYKSRNSACPKIVCNASNMNQIKKRTIDQQIILSTAMISCWCLDNIVTVVIIYWSTLWDTRWIRNKKHLWPCFSAVRGKKSLAL